jgi:hypothetical protein
MVCERCDLQIASRHHPKENRVRKQRKINAANATDLNQLPCERAAQRQSAADLSVMADI